MAFKSDDKHQYKDIEFQNFGGSHKEILCPNCGCDCVHHDLVSVFRYNQTLGEGERIIVGQSEKDDYPFNSYQLDQEPWCRGNSLVIDFWCEGCSSKPQLCIMQHKGSTFIEWRNYEPR